MLWKYSSAASPCQLIYLKNSIEKQTSIQKYTVKDKTSEPLLLCTSAPKKLFL